MTLRIDVPVAHFHRMEEAETVEAPIGTRVVLQLLTH
jgi:hypothetical protein